MIAERILTKTVAALTKRELILHPATSRMLPPAQPNTSYMLYMHVPFCEVLCPFCCFNRYPFKEEMARSYFASLRKEMLMLAALGYDFSSVYVGGGTPTVLMDELCQTLDLAREHFSVREVAVETNPNHLTRDRLEMMQGRVQRLSVGVQSFDDGLLKQMDRYEKYGSGEEIFDRIGEASEWVDSLNVDMIFNFPSQTEEILRSDLEKIIACGARQATFSPLYVSTGTSRKMAAALGTVDYSRERAMYDMVDAALAQGPNAPFERSTLWTFTRKDDNLDAKDPEHIDEYQTSCTDYPAIGSGSITHLGREIYVNTFSISEYNEAIAEGRMSIEGAVTLRPRDIMRYRFMLELYKLRLDKEQFRREFGCDVARGLPLEMAFMRANGAFATDDAHELTLTPRGRYLVTVMYRQFLSGMNNVREQARAALPEEEKHLLFGESCGEFL